MTALGSQRVLKDSARPSNRALGRYRRVGTQMTACRLATNDNTKHSGKSRLRHRTRADSYPGGLTRQDGGFPVFPTFSRRLIPRTTWETGTGSLRQSSFVSISTSANVHRHIKQLRGLRTLRPSAHLAISAISAGPYIISPFAHGGVTVPRSGDLARKHHGEELGKHAQMYNRSTDLSCRRCPRAADGFRGPSHRHRGANTRLDHCGRQLVSRSRPSLGDGQGRY